MQLQGIVGIFAGARYTGAARGGGYQHILHAVYSGEYSGVRVIEVGDLYGISAIGGIFYYGALPGFGPYHHYGRALPAGAGIGAYGGVCPAGAAAGAAVAGGAYAYIAYAGTRVLAGGAAALVFTARQERSSKNAGGN